jgi:hypothetical protein
MSKFDLLLRGYVGIGAMVTIGCNIVEPTTGYGLLTPIIQLSYITIGALWPYAGYVVFRNYLKK